MQWKLSFPMRTRRADGGADRHEEANNRFSHPC